MEKMTRKDYFEAIKVMTNVVVEAGYDADAANDIVAFVDNELTKLANRAEKDKVKRAEKRAESDELREQVYSAVTDEFQTGDQIVAALLANGIEVSKAKVVNRLGLLVTDGRVERGDVTIETSDGKHKVKAYRQVVTE